MKKFIRSTFSKIIRLVLAFALIYVSMIFYLMLSERRIAFPRAIKHTEARNAIQDTNLVKKVYCELPDEIFLEGFLAQHENIPTVLYFPDSDEDAAQFMAETQNAKNVNRLTFNYRGSGENKGTPSEKKFLADAELIATCASRYSSKLIHIGRGTGAIPATKTRTENTPLILIDPDESFAEKITSKYKIFFPKFLVHTALTLTPEDFQGNAPILLLEDRSIHASKNEKFKKNHPNIASRKREGQTLAEILDLVILPATPKEQ